MLPASYVWLAREPGPALLREALKTYGTREEAGPGDNPEILVWAKEAGLAQVYKRDATPWCGLAMALWVKRSGREPVKEPLWALNWRRFGIEAEAPSLGDILVFRRPLPGGGTAGHVGLYVGEDATAYHVLGGNQGDAVSIARLEKRRLVAARHPEWRFAAPPNRRRITLAATGRVSTDEA